MPPIIRAFPWAISMMLIAIGRIYGVVEPHSAATMFAIIPVLAVVTGKRRRGRAPGAPQ